MGKNWDEDSGIIVINETDSSAVEWIRFWNLSEPFVVYALVLWTAWSSLLDASLTWIYFAFGAQFIYLVFISPVLHYFIEKKYFLRPDQRSIWFYFFDARGIGSPKRFFRSVGKKPAGLKIYWKEVVATLGGICVLFIGSVFAFQGYISRLFGMTRERVLEVSAWGLPILLLLLFVLLPVIIRWDNYRNGIVSFLKMSGLGVLFVLAANFFFQIFPDLPLLTDTPVREKWSTFFLVPIGGKLAVYLFWGLAQQFFFLSIFNTNFARAFDICKKKGFLSAAFCSALFFGLIHLPNIWLFAFALIFGFLWSVYFMKTRNLFVMALSYCLIASIVDQLLPVSLSSGIKTYSGPASLYFIVKAGIFLVLPLCFVCFSFLQGNALKPVKIGSSLVFALILFWAYPNSAQGPDFYWGKGGNGKTWQCSRQMDLQEEGKDFTEYITSGTDGFLVSRPLSIAPEKAKTIIVDMEVVPFSTHDDGAIYFDTGNGFNRKERCKLHIKKGRMSYNIHFAPANQVVRLRLAPTRIKGTAVKLYSIKIGQGVE
ncbi:MAG: type II CAAX endopeptidase family protein [Pseudomonadota bacterium]